MDHDHQIIDHRILTTSLSDLPDAAMTVAHGRQTGLKVVIKKLIQAPIYPQVAIKLVLKNDR